MITLVATSIAKTFIGLDGDYKITLTERTNEKENVRSSFIESDEPNYVGKIEDIDTGIYDSFYGTLAEVVANLNLDAIQIQGVN